MFMHDIISANLIKPHVNLDILQALLVIGSWNTHSQGDTSVGLLTPN